MNTYTDELTYHIRNMSFYNGVMNGHKADVLVRFTTTVFKQWTYGQALCLPFLVEVHVFSINCKCQSL